MHDTIVNQLLTKIDGVDALNNILLIGMTNRRDMLDEALLRSVVTAKEIYGPSGPAIAVVTSGCQSKLAESAVLMPLLWHVIEGLAFRGSVRRKGLTFCNLQFRRPYVSAGTESLLSSRHVSSLVLPDT